MLQRYREPSPYIGFDFAPDAWAQRTFGSVALGDERRTRRVVALAAALVRQPSASLPVQTGSWAALKAASRLLAAEDVTPAKLRAPHLQQPRGVAGAAELVLLLQDTTTLDDTHQPTPAGLGP